MSTSTTLTLSSKNIKDFEKLKIDPFLEEVGESSSNLTLFHRWN